MTVQSDQTRAIDMFERIEKIELVAENMKQGPDRRTLQLVVQDELGSADPIRPVTAAKILGLTEKTVRAWVSEGVLTARSTQPRLLLEPSRVHAVLRLLRQLREAGRTRGLLDEVYRRLSDEALLGREDLQESLDQMRRGDGELVRGRAS